MDISDKYSITLDNVVIKKIAYMWKSQCEGAIREPTMGATSTKKHGGFHTSIKHDTVTPKPPRPR